MLRVQELLKERGMTSKELAEKIGITAGALSQQIKDDANPNVKTLDKIAEVLGVDTADLLKKRVETPRNNSAIVCPHCGKPIAKLVWQ